MLRLRPVDAEAAALRRVHSGQTGLGCSAELRVAQAGESGDAGLTAGICTVAESGGYVEGLAACKACLLALASDVAFASGAALPEVDRTPERCRHVQATCSWRCAVYIDLEAGGIRLSRTGVAVVQCARAPRRGVVRVSAKLALAFVLFLEGAGGHIRCCQCCSGVAMRSHKCIVNRKLRYRIRPFSLVSRHRRHHADFSPMVQVVCLLLCSRGIGKAGGADRRRTSDGRRGTRRMPPLADNPPSANDQIKTRTRTPRWY